MKRIKKISFKIVEFLRFKIREFRFLHDKSEYSINIEKVDEEMENK